MNARLWLWGGGTVAVLLAGALIIAFLVQAATPSLRNGSGTFQTRGRISRLDTQGRTLCASFQLKRLQVCALTRDPGLSEALQAAVDLEDEVLFVNHLQGASLETGPRQARFWARTVEYRGKSYGPYEPRRRWSWRVLRAEQEALLRGIAYQADRSLFPAVRQLDAALNSDVLRGRQRALALITRAQLREAQGIGLRGKKGSDYLFMRAHEDLMAAEQQDPGDAQLPPERARMLAQLGAYDEALALLEEAARQSPDNRLDFDIPRSALLRRLGRYEEALQVLEAAGDAVSDPATGRMTLRYHYNRGWTLLLMERHVEADTAFTAALTKRPEWPWVYTGRACARNGRHDFAGALADVRAASSTFDRRPGDREEADRALSAEFLNNQRKLEAAARQPPEQALELSLCERFRTNFYEPLRQRSVLLDSSATGASPD